MSVIAASLLTLLAPNAPVPDPVSFTVLRQGKPFGTHNVTFRRDGTGLVADVKIALSVKIGPLTVFSYSHSCTERWAEQALQSLNCTTEKDGKTLRLTGLRTAGEFSLKGAEYSGATGGDVLPSSYWHGFPASRTAMINSETGKVLPMTFTSIGKKTVATSNGGSISADCYALKSEIELTLCYDAQDRWVWTRFEARGQEIEYRLNTRKPG
jgi:hypothetical protein